jgi:outer membrane protein assembly factor BamB
MFHSRLRLLLAGGLLVLLPACSDDATSRPGKESAAAAATSRDSPAGPLADTPGAAPVAGASNPSAEMKIEQTVAGGSKETERTGEDWPEFLGPRGTGVSGETGLLEKWPDGGPPVLWKKQIGEGYSAPSVRGNRLVLFHRPAGRQFSGPEEVVECLAADTGKPLWRYAYPTRYVDPYGYNGGPRCTPLLTADRCYTFGAEGMLTCLDLASGKQIWQRDTAEEFQIPPAFFGVGASPILEQNRLIVMVGGHPRSGMVAFDAATGKTVWENVGSEAFPDPPVRIQRDRPPVKLASYATPLAATIHGKRHVLCFMRPGLVSVDPQTGEPNFSFWFRSQLHDSVNAARPVVVGDRVFLSAAYETGAALLKVHADGKKYDVVWQDVDAMQNHWSTCIHHDGYLYGFSGRHEPGSTFRCLELASGKLMWATQDVNANDEPDPKAGLGATEPKYYGRGSAILAEGKFIVLAERGTLALVQAAPHEFAEVSRVKYPEAGYPSWTAPVLSRRRLYLSVARERHDEFGRYAHDYHLLCLDLAGPAGAP